MNTHITNPNQTVTAPAAGDNSAGRMDGLLADLKTLGKAEAMGIASRPMAGLKVCVAAFEDKIDERDATALYDAYQAESAKVALRNPLARPQTSESRASQVTKLRSFIKMGMLPGIDGPDVLKRSETIKEGLFKAGTAVYPAYVSMLRVISAQMKQPDAELSDDVLAGLVAKDEKADKSEIEKLVSAYKAAAKLHEAINLPGTEAAVRGFGDAIVELGGDLPPLTKADKDQVAFMTKARAMGFVPAGITSNIANVPDAE